MIPPPPKHIPPRGPLKTSARQRVLAQWRGVDLAPIESARAIRARNAGDVIPKLMRDLRMERRRAEAEIVRVWNHLINPTIVAHAQPTGLRNGTLFVIVDHSVWHYEIIRYYRKEILQRMQFSFGREMIKKVHYRVG